MTQKNIKSDDNRLISGQVYDLQGLFVNTDNSKIVIPDLQRDYCWGTTGNLVDDFLGNLIKHFEISQLNPEKEPENLIMGLIYGYYEKDRPYLQLCDGQQRLTTLYLLLGLLNIMSEPDNPFKRFLISDFEYELDDKEPTLLYAIRDSSLYFLSDLVCKFFIKSEVSNYVWKNSIPSEFIQKQTWWFHEYESDPTIVNMLYALDKMATLLKDKFHGSQMVKFGEYITQHLLFVYYNMGSRKDGEETFVIINTTGEPLTSTENLKPLVVTHGPAESKEWKRRSAIWEKIDNYFWQNRPDGDDTSDAGMKEFLRLVIGVYDIEDENYYQLLTDENYTFPIEKTWKSISGESALIVDCMDELYQVFTMLNVEDKHKETLVRCSLLSVSNPLKPFSVKKNLNEYFIILPVLRYCVKYKDATSLDIKRVYTFFENLARYTSIASSNDNIFHAIKAIDEMPSSDIVSLLKVSEKVNSFYVLTPEEKKRLEIYANNLDSRCEIEEAFNAISSHPVLQGRIECIIHWATMDGKFYLSLFQQYASVFNVLFQIEDDGNLFVSDLTIISIACVEGIMGNPIETGDKCDFLYRKEQWNNFFCNSKRNWERMGCYFKRLIGADNVKDARQKVIEEWLQKDSSKDCCYYHFVSYFKENGFAQIVFANTKDYWQNKRLVISSPLSKGGSCFVRVRYRINYNWQDFYLFGTKRINCGGRDGWKNLECYVGEDGSCLYIDHVTYNISIDFLYDKDSDKGQLRIFSRDGSVKKNGSEILNKIFEKYCLEETQNDGRHVTPMMSTEELIEYFEKIRAFIDAEINR